MCVLMCVLMCAVKTTSQLTAKHVGHFMTLGAKEAVITLLCPFLPPTVAFVYCSVFMSYVF